MNYVPTLLGINAAGETYGVDGGTQGAPDLVLVSATTPSGSQRDGYARRVDLDAFSPDHPAQPTDPAQAVQLQAERDKAYPSGWDVPVSESDGTTQIGVFHVGG